MDFFAEVQRQHPELLLVPGIEVTTYAGHAGDPTTLVWAEELSVPALLAGLRQGRTVVKLQGPADPMIELSAGALRVGDTVAGRSAVLTAQVAGGLGYSLRFVKNGVPEDGVDIDADPFVLNKDVMPPGLAGDPTLEDRWRVEVVVDNQPRTVTSHLYVRRDPMGPDPVGDRDAPTPGCAASARKSSRGSLVLGLLSSLGGALAFRRRRQKVRPG